MARHSNETINIPIKSINVGAESTPVHEQAVASFANSEFTKGANVPEREAKKRDAEILGHYGMGIFVNESEAIIKDAFEKLYSKNKKGEYSNGKKAAYTPIGTDTQFPSVPYTGIPVLTDEGWKTFKNEESLAKNKPDVKFEWSNIDSDRPLSAKPKKHRSHSKVEVEEVSEKVNLVREDPKQKHTQEPEAVEPVEATPSISLVRDQPKQKRARRVSGSHRAPDSQPAPASSEPAKLPAFIGIDASGKLDTNDITSTPIGVVPDYKQKVLFMRVPTTHSKEIGEAVPVDLGEVPRDYPELKDKNEAQQRLDDALRHFEEVKDHVIKNRFASVSSLTRRLGLPIDEAERMMKMLEDKGIIGPDKERGPRDILVAQPEPNKDAEAPMANQDRHVVRRPLGDVDPYDTANGLPQRTPQTNIPLKSRTDSKDLDEDPDTVWRKLNNEGNEFRARNGSQANTNGEIANSYFPDISDSGAINFDQQKPDGNANSGRQGNFEKLSDQRKVGRIRRLGNRIANISNSVEARSAQPRSSSRSIGDAADEIYRKREESRRQRRARRNR